jgi:ATP adenylyltransferase
MRNNLFIPNKLDYVKGRARPNVPCILCAVVERSDKVERLEVHRTNLFTISLNLYPYSPGHLIIFPNRHIVDPRELNSAEVVELHELQCLSLDALNKVYQTQSYNAGYNIGTASGASIEHLHLHVVPRYPRELGFIDVIGGARIIIEDPNVTQQKLRGAFSSTALAVSR